MQRLGLGSVLFKFTWFILFGFMLAACGENSDPQQEVISGDQFRAALPIQLATRAVDETNLLVDVIVDGGDTFRVQNLVVDSTAGTFSGTISAIPEGAHSLTLVYSVVDATQGTVQVATTSGISVNVVANEDTPADFSSTTLTLTDTDGDTVTNLDELDYGSDVSVMDFSLGGTVSGLAGSGLEIQLNSANDKTITADGSYVFLPGLIDGESYAVSVKTQPTSPSQTCTVSNDSGTINAAGVSDIDISCVTNTYSVGGVVSGLALKTTGIVLQNNAGDDQTVMADGSFSFTAQNDGSAYQVTISSTPNPSQVCTVQNGSGTLQGGAVSNVVVQCSNIFLGATASGNRSCALWGQGQAKCWGDNNNGLLGLPVSLPTIGGAGDEMGDSLTPVDLSSVNVPVTVENGSNHSCALLDNATIKCWGANWAGQLGQGHRNAVGIESNDLGDNLPVVLLGSGRTATAISLGNGHSCALLDNGSVKCWGYNWAGQLGQGDTDYRGDDPDEMGDFLLPIDLGSGRTATAIAAGDSHTCALLDNGSVKCWGYNWAGQLGQGNTAQLGDGASEMGDNLAAIALGTGRTATAISVGLYSSCALLDNGSVKCWGYNWAGQLGQEHTNSIGDGINEMGDNLAAITLGSGRTATDISSGTYHNCALLDNGGVKCWGYNFNGQLGQGHTNSLGDGLNEMDNLTAIALGSGRTATAIAAGGNHSCAQLDDSSVKCWGSNWAGQLGQGNTDNLGDEADEMSDNLPAIDLGSGRTSLKIAAGENHNCSLLDNAELVCWGSNSSGVLGIGQGFQPGNDPDEMGLNLPTIDLGTGRGVSEFAGRINSQHSCALLDDGSVKCWGINWSGQLGQGHTDVIGDGRDEQGDNLPAIDLGAGRTATAVAASFEHSCALLDDGSVKCWGANWGGQLGQGHTDTLGDEPDEMGDNLAAIDLGSGRTAMAISVGGYHNCALLDDASVKCWGYNGTGQLGQGHTNYLGDGASEMGDNLPAIDLGTGRTAVAITSGSSHSCALLDDDTVKCWGYNWAGQLGQGHANILGDAVSEMGDNLLAVGLGSGRSATAITSGSEHSCAVLDNGSLKCWGYNGLGQLGQGHTDSLGDGAVEMGDTLPAIDLGTGRTAASITSGSSHSCAVLDDESVKCWGYNNNGQLGQGHTDNLGDGAGEMGDDLPAIDLEI